MISGSILYAVAEAVAPLYFAMAVGYAAVRWWGVLSAEQCAGVNHFVAVLAIPLLVFRMIAGNNPYAMNLRLLLADSLQKLLILAALLAWALCRHRRDESHSSAKTLPVAWAVTMFSLATLQNTVIIGLPLLEGMFGASGGELIVQIVFLQLTIWFNVVVFLYEFIAATTRTYAAAAGKPTIAPLPQPGRDASADTNVSICPSEGNDRDEAADPVPPTTTQKEEAEIVDVGAATHRLDVESQEEVGMVVPPPLPRVRDVMVMAGKKLMKAPCTYASFLGLLWSLISFRCGIKMPTIIDNSLSIISTTAVGLSTFSIGTFMARQTRFISCGYFMAIVSILIRFLIGPVIMGATSLAVGLHGTSLHIAIVQAALPLSVLSFVYAEEYKLHADIMSTGVIVGNFASVPITIVYYMLV